MHAPFRVPQPVALDAAVEIHEFSQPVVTPELVETIRDFARCNLEICLINNLGMPAQMRDYLGFTSQHWATCAFMGGSSPRDLPGIADLTYAFAYEVARVNRAVPNLRLPLVNGGGNMKMPPFHTGLMGEWTSGIAQAGHPICCVITDGLIKKEGLPRAPGIVFCLLTNEADKKLGARTDGLMGISDCFIVFPGGLGTKMEFLERMTNTSVDRDPNGKRVIVVNPIVRDPDTSKPIRYFDLFLKSCLIDNRHALTQTEAIHNLNNQVVLYNPRKDAASKEMTEDMLSLFFTIRDMEADPVLQSGLFPLPHEILDIYTQPLHDGNTIERPFPGRKSGGSWFYALQARLDCRPAKSGHLYTPHSVVLG